MKIQYTEYKNFRYPFIWIENPAAVKPPIMFISGGFQEMKSWFKLTRVLQVQSSILLADLPGTGQSDPLPEETPAEFTAAAAISLFEHLGIDEIFIGSASYGTAIGYLTAQMSKKVKRLILGGTMKTLAPHMFDGISKSLKLVKDRDLDSFAIHIANLVTNNNPNNYVHQGDFVKEMFIRQLRRINQDDCKRFIQRTQSLINGGSLDLKKAPEIPILVFTGEHDPLCTPTYCSEVAREMPDSAFGVVRDADHLFHFQRPETMEGILRWFFLDEPLSSVPHFELLELNGAAQQRWG
ncbi:MAG: alpha/beta hydrolase [bacterium]|nr:alpha/beta hydrolase [bacterium]